MILEEKRYRIREILTVTTKVDKDGKMEFCGKIIQRWQRQTKDQMVRDEKCFVFLPWHSYARTRNYSIRVRISVKTPEDFFGGSGR